jgi:hypothetical protein
MVRISLAFCALALVACLGWPAISAFQHPSAKTIAMQLERTVQPAVSVEMTHQDGQKRDRQHRTATNNYREAREDGGVRDRRERLAAKHMLLVLSLVAQATNS